jgi:hypothetical protein
MHGREKKAIQMGCAWTVINGAGKVAGIIFARYTGKRQGDQLAVRCVLRIP